MHAWNTARWKETANFLKPNHLSWTNYRAYPVEEFKKMTKQEKSYSLMIYTAKLTEKLQENENGQYSKIRQGHDYTRSCRIPKKMSKSKVYYTGQSKGDTTHQNSKETLEFSKVI